MKIQRLETYSTQMVGFVRVITDEGAEGWGQTSTFNADITAMVFHRQVAPIALGADITDLDGLNDRVIEGTYKFPGSYVCRALTGLDTALWDLRGKLEGKGVCELLGGAPKKLVPYGSSMRRDITPEDEARRLVRLRDEYGFRAFKIRVGKVNGHDQDQWPGRTEALVPTVRKALGDDIALKVDGNSCYSPPRAIEVGHMLEDYGVGHFEEPCPYWKLDWTREVTRFLDVPVAGGEQDYDLEQWARMTWGHVMDIAQPDVCYIGGITRALRACKMAEENGMPVVPHSANLSLVTVFTMHLLAAIPNAGPHFEFSIENTPWTKGLYTPELVVKDGEVQIPQGPGWGVEINPDWLAKAERQVSELE
ncbi:MAG: mandelate racemase/muconate lactonizing enzyme family protein [Chloroflexi bacterium]|nr:mandelate racemase/muconate lactonizing enzyme family protein [Chloroflexota bacterium]